MLEYLILFWLPLSTLMPLHFNKVMLSMMFLAVNFLFLNFAKADKRWNFERLFFLIKLIANLAILLHLNLKELLHLVFLLKKNHAPFHTAIWHQLQLQHTFHPWFFWKDHHLAQQGITLLLITKLFKVSTFWLSKSWCNFRDRIRQFKIANYESFFVSSESKTTLLQLFHEP